MSRMDSETRTILRRALLELRVAADDADAVSQDMLLPPRSRDLGPALHALNYGEARRKIVSLLALLIKLAEGEPGGDGGAPPAH